MIPLTDFFGKMIAPRVENLFMSSTPPLEQTYGHLDARIDGVSKKRKPEVGQDRTYKIDLRFKPEVLP